MKCTAKAGRCCVCNDMKSALHSRRCRRIGFTLLEMSTAMGLMVMLSSALVVMLQQHLTFLGLAQKQSFLAEEAPKIGNILGRIFQQADHFFIYSNLQSAQGGGAPVLTGGGAVRLFFKGAMQAMEERIIATETDTSGVALRFHAKHADGTTSSWLVCQGLQGAVFRADEGILTVTLTGPNNEEISYCGGAR